MSTDTEKTKTTEGPSQIAIAMMAALGEKNPKASDKGNKNTSQPRDGTTGAKVSMDLPSERRRARADQAGRVKVIMERAESFEEALAKLPEEVRTLFADQDAVREVIAKKLHDPETTKAQRDALQKQLVELNAEFTELLNVTFKNSLSESEKETARAVIRSAFVIMELRRANNLGQIIEVMVRGNEYTGVRSAIALSVVRRLNDVEEKEISKATDDYRAAVEKWRENGRKEDGKPKMKFPGWYVHVGNDHLRVENPGAEAKACAALGLDPQRDGVRGQVKKAWKAAKEVAEKQSAEDREDLYSGLTEGAGIAEIDAGLPVTVVLTDPGEANSKGGWFHGGKLKVTSDGTEVVIDCTIGNTDHKTGRQYHHPNGPKIVGVALTRAEIAKEKCGDQELWLAHKVLRRAFALARNAAEKRRQGMETLQAEVAEATSEVKKVAEKTALPFISLDEFRAGGIGIAVVPLEGRWLVFDKKHEVEKTSWNPVVIAQRFMELSKETGEAVRKIRYLGSPVRTKELFEGARDVAFNEFSRPDNQEPFSGVRAVNTNFGNFLVKVASPLEVESAVAE